MTCASCVAHIQSALVAVDGVTSANVNLATERATVEYLPTQTTLKEIKQAIIDAGYEVREATQASEQASAARREARRIELPQLQLRTAVSALLTLLIVLGSMRGFLTFLPAIMANNVLLLLLTLPVLFWAGLPFLKSAVATLRQRSTDTNTLIAIAVSAVFVYSVAVTVFPAFFVGLGLGAGAYFDIVGIAITLLLIDGGSEEAEPEVSASTEMRDIEREARQREIATLKTKVAVSSFLTVFIVLGSMRDFLPFVPAILANNLAPVRT